VTARPAVSESKSANTISSLPSAEEAFGLDTPTATAKVDADDDLESFLNDLDL